MPKVLIMSPHNYQSKLQETALWMPDVERIELQSHDQVLDAVLAHRPNLVLLDGIGVSNASAAESATRSVRNLEETRSTSIAILTCLDISSSDEEALMKAGANILIPTPSDPLLWGMKLERLISVHSRHEVRVPVRMVTWTKIEGHDDIIQGVALNLNMGGMLLQVPIKLAPDMKLDLSFHLPGETEGLSAVGEPTTPARSRK